MTDPKSQSQRKSRTQREGAGLAGSPHGGAGGAGSVLRACAPPGGQEVGVTGLYNLRVWDTGIPGMFTKRKGRGREAEGRHLQTWLQPHPSCVAATDPRPRAPRLQNPSHHFYFMLKGFPQTIQPNSPMLRKLRLRGKLPEVTPMKGGAMANPVTGPLAEAPSSALSKCAFLS